MLFYSSWPSSQVPVLVLIMLHFWGSFTKIWLVGYRWWLTAFILIIEFYFYFFYWNSQWSAMFIFLFLKDRLSSFVLLWWSHKRTVKDGFKIMWNFVSGFFDDLFNRKLVTGWSTNLYSTCDQSPDIPVKMMTWIASVFPVKFGWVVVAVATGTQFLGKVFTFTPVTMPSLSGLVPRVLPCFSFLLKAVWSLNQTMPSTATILCALCHLFIMNRLGWAVS